MAALQIYGCIMFRKMRHLVIVSKRYPHLIVAEAVTSILFCVVVVPIWSNYYFDAVDLGDERVTYMTGQVTRILTCLLITDLETARLWLIYFDLKYLHCSKNQEWKSEIMPSKKNRNWYIRNKQKWGNQRYVIKVRSLCTT